MSELDNLVEHIEVAQQALEWAKGRIDELEALTKWQPIEVAPKDGTSILTFKKKSLFYEYDVGHVDMSNLKSGGNGFYGATHWIPLPPPPTD